MNVETLNLFSDSSYSPWFRMNLNSFLPKFDEKEIKVTDWSKFNIRDI